ncbi:MAG: branched-chain amino acid aminotransferase [Rhodospirillaceae bacterium]|nr:branched-chain amino acid aminotransferase [Rhodospirillaceae bacterium]MBL6931125.1 branched-chain amino acid aminotransferase [Rhodospirillales bacterium]MBL6942369.1 branched-chain amino acid aminotransferase [Rhodospirillales bacterium]
MAKTHFGKGSSQSHIEEGYTYVDDHWVEGDPQIISPKSNGMWLSSTVFDGARAFKGVAPDLDLHCARAIRSAEALGLAPAITGPEIEELAWQGIHKFPEDTELYVCPMFFGNEGFIVPNPESTRFVLTVSPSAIPAPDGFSACLSSFQRPAANMAPTDAKASCLYPNIARSVAEASKKGFDTAVVTDPDGNVAEFAYANLFMAKDGEVHTPAINGTFLNGITRQRVIERLKSAGVTVHERTITFAELEQADEVFGTGNYYKVAPCTRLEGRSLQPGPLYTMARELYFAFAEAGRK